MSAGSVQRSNGVNRRHFVLGGAALASTALAGLQAFRPAHAAPPAGPRPAMPPQPDAVVGNTVPAFPGCEGAGKFTTGGRGHEVVEVTTLADSGPGSLREALSAGNRTVVFRVGGTIELESGLDVTGDNTTIAGQTAPGGGIAITRNEFKIKANNVIVRYLRIRAGDGSQPGGIDTFGGRALRNIVVDHCSVGWGIDECFSLYGNYDVTVSNCIIHEGLSMSEHLKGLHGFGGLWGGQNITYYGNLLIHQGARNPRFSFTEDMEMRVDHRNNVVYNHGFSSLYGAEWCEGINVVGNYYKPGPATLATIAPHIIEPYRGGSWYLAGNAVEGYPDITADNTLGISYQVVGQAADPSVTPQAGGVVNTAGGGINLLDEPATMTQPLPSTMTAEEAYEHVLANVGASLPRYDSVDTRLLAELRAGTGRLINSQSEVGGYPVLDGGEPPRDSDHDGIPDTWERANGLKHNDPADGALIREDGYSNLEHYLESIVSNVSGYPSVTMTGPDPDTVLSGPGTEQAITVTAEATAPEGAEITAVQFFADDTMIGEVIAPPYQVTWSAPVGTWYLSALAIDSQGAKTHATSAPVHVSRTSDVGPWVSADIGSVPLAGAAFRDGTTGDLTITGSGKIRGRTDAFHYLYQPIHAPADNAVEIIGRIDDVSRPWEGVFAGFMFRESLDENSRYFAGGLQVMGDGLKGHVTRIQSHGPGPSIGSYPYDADELLDIEPQWFRLIRRGLEFECHLSGDSLQWTRIGYERIPMGDDIYVGLVIDGNKESNAIAHHTTATFHNVKINK
ncbi:Ig-like domain-containing protein [Pseudactinotalea terrae]|uniref:Ig-like domain-containing protein n=1 Tax=Pseudactinotalea terrae TaxID=1743262 RepID=UPI0012E1827A|nr:Ig-like domain-containing protein [Pseudactinotalea terrae]